MKIRILLLLQLVALLFFVFKTIPNSTKNFDEISNDLPDEIVLKEKEFAKNTGNYDLAIELGNNFIDIGNYKNSEYYFLKAKEISPDKVDSFLGLGFLYRYQGFMEKSLNEYESALKIDPGSSALYMEIGKLYRNWERYEDAKKAFQKAIELDPLNDSVYSYGLGYLYRDIGDLATAEKYFRKAFEINKSEFNYGALGDIYRDMGKFEDSEKMFLKAIELNPNGENLGGLAWLYVEKKEYSKAEKYFREYLEKVRPKAEMYFGLAQSLFEQKMYQEAEEEMVKALKLNHKTASYYDFLQSVYKTDNKPNLSWAVSVRKVISMK